MAKPRVLAFIDWYAPGYKAGGPVRSMLNLVEHLRDRVDFHIVTRNTDYTEDTPFPGIGPDRWTTLPGGEKVWYASKAGQGRRAWKRILREGPWDAIYINGLYSWTYNILPLWLTKARKTLRVVAVRGMLAAGAMRQGTSKKLLFLSLARTLDLYRGVRFQATNAEEAQDIKTYINRYAEVVTVPNLPGKAPEGTSPIVKEKGSALLVSVARIAPEKNTLFALECLKNVQGPVRFHLYGPVYDEGYWAKCRAVIAALPAHVQVEHKGPVRPGEVAGILAAHHLLFMPSAGENFGHAMLEALLAARPLLISDRTPWRGLEADEAGWDLPLDRPEAFSRAIDRVVAMDQAAYDQWAAGAFRRGGRYLSDPTLVEASFKLFQG